ncbi:MAG: efflux RND transporter permease subunit [Rhodospirillales bacterium]|nr:efflux RND transporter permease subunit [Rhodospirillales bacterium]
MIRFCAAHPTISNLMMLSFFVIGIITGPQLLRETFPRVQPREVEVKILYPGASAEEVEEGVCRPIEDAIDKVNNVEEITCESREGIGKAKIKMNEGKDFDKFFTDVKSEVEAVTTFPEISETPVTKQLGRTDFVASVAIIGPRELPALKAYAQDVKDRMLLWGGISQVSIKGFSQHQVRIELSDSTLRQFGLSAQDIANSISKQSIDLPLGTIETKEREVLVRYVDQRRRLSEFEDLIVVSGTQGGQVRLGDIAQISDAFELDESKTTFNGQRAAILDISKTETEDQLKAIDAINAFVTNENAITPKSIQLTVTNDLSSIVQDRLDLLLKNGMQGLILVFIGMWLFFGLRFSFWVAMGLPVSFMGGIGLMLLVGYSINMLTMVGLLIAIGVLMDDAIVISENVAAHRQKGKSPLEAAVDGAKEVFPGVVSSFATTACIFGSLVFLEGTMGEILKVVPVVMLFVLTVSLVEAFLILPNHLHHTLEHLTTERPTGLRGKMEDMLDFLRRNIVGRIAEAAIQWRYLTIGIAICVLILSAAMPASGLLKFVAFPELEGDVIEARILLPQGTPLAKTDATVDHLVKAIEATSKEFTPEQPDQQSLVRNIMVTNNKNLSAFEEGPHVATITVDILWAEVRTKTIDQIIASWREKAGVMPDVLSLKFTESAMGPAGLPIDVRVIGDDLNSLNAASAELVEWFSRYKGTQDISGDLRPGKPELRIRMQEGALSLGVDSKMIADQLRSAFYGATANEVQVGPESLDVDIQLIAEDRDSLADLDYFVVTGKDGAQIPLSVVAHISEGRGVARINRVDHRRTVTIQGELDVSVANADTIIKDTMKRFAPDLAKRYPGVEVSVQGQSNEVAKTQKSMLRGFLVGLVGVFILLSFQFRSYVEPLVVMVAIPFAFVGVVWGHVIMGLDISMPSMMGFVSLAGIVVNNSILLVAFTKIRHSEGMSIAEAAGAASRGRFRAIFLTTLTTIMGLLPILSETSMQAQILIPLVTSIAFGLIASAILVLFVIPALYVILDDIGLSTLSKEKQAEEAVTAV